MRWTIRLLVSALCLSALFSPALRAEVPRLDFSSFLGGSDVDSAYAVTTDAAGSVYLAGVTLSSDFPDPHPVPDGAQHEVFVVKLDSAGRLLWNVRFGGSGNELPNGIAAARDRVWVTGWTDSDDFPRIGPLQGQPSDVAGKHDAFVTALDAADGSLLSSTNLGGSADDIGEGVAVDAGGHVYVTGASSSPDFPAAGTPRRSTAGVDQPFVAKLSADGSRLVYSRRLGGTAGGSGQAIAVDAAGHALVAGFTYSQNFPVAHAEQAAWRGGFSEGFVVKVDPSGRSLVWSTFLGGTGEEGLQGIAVDGNGRVWVTGWTSSPDFPGRAASQRRLRGETDAVVSGFTPGGKLIASTFLGGGQAEVGEAIAVDAAGHLRVAGGTSSADFPVVHPLKAECGLPEPLCADAFVAEIRPGGTRVVWATYLGGSDASHAYGVAVDTQGNTWSAGVTEASDFPQLRSLQPFAAGIADAWVAKLISSPANRPPAAEPPGGGGAPARPTAPWIQTHLSRSIHKLAGRSGRRAQSSQRGLARAPERLFRSSLFLGLPPTGGSPCVARSGRSPVCSCSRSSPLPPQYRPVSRKPGGNAHSPLKRTAASPIRRFSFSPGLPGMNSF